MVYANDITQAIHHSKVIQYADDTTMSLVSNDVSGLKEGLVDDLEGVARWVVKWAENTAVAFEYIESGGHGSWSMWK